MKLTLSILHRIHVIPIELSLLGIVDISDLGDFKPHTSDSFFERSSNFRRIMHRFRFDITKIDNKFIFIE